MRLTDLIRDNFQGTKYLTDMKEYFVSNGVVKPVDNQYEIDMYVASDFVEDDVVVCRLPLEIKGETVAVTDWEFYTFGSEGTQTI